MSDWAICCISVCAGVTFVAAASLANNIAYFRWGRWLDDRHGLAGLKRGRVFMEGRPRLSPLVVKFRIDWRWLLGDRGD